MEISIIDNPREFSRLRRPWNDLLDSCTEKRAFFTFEWFECFVDAFRLHNKLAVVLLRSEGDIVGILPLIKDHFSTMGNRFDMLMSISNVHTPKFSFIIRPDYENSLCRVILETRKYLPWDFIRLDYISEKSYMLDQLSDVKARCLSVKRLPLLRSPYILINCDWEVYYSGISKNLRTSIERRKRKMERDFAVEFERINGNGLGSEHLYEAFTIEHGSWKGRNRSSILSGRRVTRFYHDLALTMNRNGWFELLFLKCSGSRVAFDYCLKFDGNYEMVKIGYDERYKEYSPGMVLRKMAIMEAFKHRYRRYDFLGGPDQYKLKMADGIEQLYTLYIFNNTARSRIMRWILFDIKEALDQIGLKSSAKRLYGILKRQSDH